MFVARETSIRAQSSSTAHLKNVCRWGPQSVASYGCSPVEFTDNRFHVLAGMVTVAVL
jgi:hypothetical protein